MKKTRTFDLEPLYEVTGIVELPVEYSNRASLLMNMELVTGEHKKKPFRFIMNVSGGSFRLEYGDTHMDFKTSDLVTVMMNKLLDLEKERKAK